ncbi:sulfate transporter, partial [Trifolium medium]|nr:sulfate transporter [Trifolium medium]
APDAEKEGPGPLEGVQVGDIEIKLGAGQKRVARNEDQKKGDGHFSKDLDMPADAVKGQVSRIFLRNFRTKSDDVQWAHNGLVATVINGEAIPVVQNRITDAGFNDLVITPMGADKVFIRSSKGDDAMLVVSGAEEFFKLVFSNWMRWEKDVVPYQRGAWVRLYGVPLHAWNVDFFKLCVFDCGRFLRADSCSVDKDRLDFARVLIATPDLDIVKKVERVLVDGVLVEVKIVEEWGYAMGEDTCLFEEENGSEASQSDYDVGHVDPENRRNVDMLVDGLEEEDGDDFQGKSDVERSNKPDDNPSVAGE